MTLPLFFMLEDCVLVFKGYLQIYNCHCLYQCAFGIILSLRLRKGTTHPVTVSGHYFDSLLFSSLQPIIMKFLNFKSCLLHLHFLLKLLGYRFHVYNSVKHDLHTASFTHHPKQSLFPSPCVCEFV